MKLRRSWIPWFGLGLAACFMDSDRKTHGKPGGGSLAGTLYFEDGEAAVDAQVMGFPVDHIPDTSSRHGSTAGSVFVARTDAQGRYSLDSVSEGYYSIIGESDGKVSYQDSVYVSASGAHSADTLQLPESLSGVVSLQPNHSTLSATVQILGTNAYANVGADGRFRIGGLAGGSYRIRVVSTIGEYTPLYASLRTAAAQDDSLSDTLRVPYTGIPVVTGLAYAYDTARGIVSLSWSPVDYPMLGTYVVLRDSAGALEPTERALALSPGPAFADTLLLPSRTGLFTDADTLDRPLEYRIKVRNKSNQTGLSYGTLRVDAVPPHRVRTSIALRLASVRWDSAEAADSIVIIATLGNPGRGLAGVQWAVGSRPDTTATRPLRGARSAVDTLRFGWSGQGPFTVHVFVRDEAGILREDSLRIPGNTAPTVQADPADSAWAGRKYQVVLRVSDPDGDTLRVLADNLPRWLSYSPAAKAFSGTPGSADTGTTEEIRVRITDGRRWDSLPAFRIRVLLPKGEPWTVRPSQLPDGRSFGALPAYSDGRIYAFMWSGNQMVRHVYHTGSRTWEASPVFPMPGWRSVRTIHILGEEAFLFGHTDGTSLSIDNRFDLRTGEVSPLPPRQHVRGWFASVAHGGRFYVIGGRVETRFGVGVTESVISEAGDFLFVPPGVPHEANNLSATEPARAIVARNDPAEQDKVVPYRP